MSKKWFLTLIFPFLFVILSGFGYPQENVEKKTQSDSTTITLKFQNPNLKIVDERNLDLITKFIEERDLFPAVLKIKRGTRVATYFFCKVEEESKNED